MLKSVDDVALVFQLWTSDNQADGEDTEEGREN